MIEENARRCEERDVVCNIFSGSCRRISWNLTFCSKATLTMILLIIDFWSERRMGEDLHLGETSVPYRPKGFISD